MKVRFVGETQNLLFEKECKALPNVEDLIIVNDGTGRAAFHYTVACVAHVYSYTSTDPKLSNFTEDTYTVALTPWGRTRPRDPADL